MKLNQHYNYSDTKEALTKLTDAYFKTGDIKLKAMRDLLEDYLSQTEYIGNIEKVITEEGKDIEEE